MPDSWVVSCGVRPRTPISVSATTSEQPWPKPATSAHTSTRSGAVRSPITDTNIGVLAATAPATWLDDPRSRNGIVRPPARPASWNRNRWTPAVRAEKPVDVSIVGSHVTNT